MSTWAGNLPSCLGAVEDLGEYRRGPLQVIIARERLPVSLEDRLDDEFGRVVTHRVFQAGQHRFDNRADVIGLVQHLDRSAVGGLGRQHADLEEDVFLAREVEVEQRLRYTRGPADVRHRRVGVSIGAPQCRRRQHQGLLGRVGASLLKRRSTLTLVSIVTSRYLGHLQGFPTGEIVDPSLTYSLAFPRG